MPTESKPGGAVVGVPAMSGPRVSCACGSSSRSTSVPPATPRPAASASSTSATPPPITIRCLPGEIGWVWRIRIGARLAIASDAITPRAIDDSSRTARDSTLLQSEQAQGLAAELDPLDLEGRQAAGRRVERLVRDQVIHLAGRGHRGQLLGDVDRFAQHVELFQAIGADVTDQDLPGGGGDRVVEDREALV